MFLFLKLQVTVNIAHLTSLKLLFNNDGVLGDLGDLGDFSVTKNVATSFTNMQYSGYFLIW